MDESSIATLDRAALERQQWATLLPLLQRVAAVPGFYQRRFAAAGIVVEDLQGLADFKRLIGGTTKEELLEDRLQYPPFGSQLVEPIGRYTRFCQTSGTSTGQPMAWVDTEESWAAMLSCWRRVYAAAGLVPGQDRLFFAFSFGPFLGFWTAFEAGARDFMVLPGGGLSSQARLECMARYGVTVLCCTPTYALRLGEQIGEASAVRREDLAVRTVIVAGEAGGSVPAVRARIEALWGARVFDHHGMTEVGPVSFEQVDCPGTLLVIEESYVAEIVHPETGEEVAEGECGELLLTTLERAACPLLRYRTGDWVKKVSHQGRLGLEGGVLCRLDDMVVVRGVNVYPSAVEEVVRQFAEVVEFEVEQRRVDAMEEIRVKVELAAGSEAIAKKLEARLRDTFALRIPVVQVASGSLPRYEFKARRWRKVSAD